MNCNLFPQPFSSQDMLKVPAISGYKSLCFSSPFPCFTPSLSSLSVPSSCCSQLLLSFLYFLRAYLCTFLLWREFSSCLPHARRYGDHDRVLHRSVNVQLPVKEGVTYGLQSLGSPARAGCGETAVQIAMLIVAIVRQHLLLSKPLGHLIIFAMDTLPPEQKNPNKCRKSY